MKKETIRVAIPTVKGLHVSFGIAEFCWVLGVLSSSTKSPYNFELKFFQGYRPVEFARNAMVQWFLSNKEAKRLWFIDDDVFPSKNILDLLKVGGDIVGGVVPIFGITDPEKDYQDLSRAILKTNAIVRKDGHLTHYVAADGKGERVVDVEGIGSACMIIRREVFEDPRMELPEESGKKGRFKPFFRSIQNQDKEMVLQEDVEFCLRAKEVGFSVKCDTGVVCNQYVELDTDGILGLAADYSARLMKQLGFNNTLEELEQILPEQSVQLH